MSGPSTSSFLKNYYGESIKNLVRVKQKRFDLTNTQIGINSPHKNIVKRSAQTPKIISTSAYPLLRRNSEKGKFKQLSNQLKGIQESIKQLNDRKIKRQSKHRPKAITQSSQLGSKSKLYKDVLNQISEIKQKKFYQISEKPEVRKNDWLKNKKQIKVQKKPQESQQRNLFYGMDYIDGIQFKIKIKMNRQNYILLAKNSNTKLLMQMSVSEYKDLSNKLLANNPCNILKYLSIQNGKLKLKTRQKIASKSLKCFLSYY